MSATVSLLFGALCAMAGVSSAAPTAEQMRIYLKNRPEQDEIAWKDPARGAAFTVRVISSTETTLTVEKQLASGLTVRTLPLADLGTVKITPAPEELALLEKVTPGAAGALRVLWESRKALVGKAAGVSETGIALTKALRLTATSDAYAEAQKTASHIVRYEPNPGLKAAARAEADILTFLHVLEKADPPAKEKAAWEITEKTREDNPDLMLLATACLADLHFSRLRSIEEENPRWTEDQEVKPLRDKIYHLTLDFALYPSLFHGSRAQESAAGLSRAARVYEFTRDNALLKGVLEDLTALYPDSPQAKAEAPLLERLRQADQAGRLSSVLAEPAEKNPPADPESPPADATPPRTYNLFGD